MKKLIFFIPMLLFLIGCNSLQKQEYKARNFYEQQKPKLAELCHLHFPVKDLEVIPGDPIIVIDTVYSKEIIQVDCPDGSKADCPPPKIINNTTTIRDTIKVLDTALTAKLGSQIKKQTKDIETLEKENESLKNDLKEQKQKNTNQTFIIIGLCIALLGSVGEIFKLF